MKLNLIAATALFGLAVAQSSTSTGAASATTSLSPEASCAKKCSETDLCCVASCYKVPCPSDSQANDTVKCVAACPQGTGSPSDTDRYASCQNSCYSSHFFPATKLSDSGSSATHASSNSDSKTTGTSDSDSSSSTGSSTGQRSGSSASATGSSTGTSSGSEASETANAAALKLGVSTVGVIGLVLGAFAL